jgi:hypothetical protein
MLDRISTTDSYSRLNVASMNVLFETRFPERVPPQSQRILAHAATIRAIEAELGAPLDAFGVQELHKPKNGPDNPQTLLDETSAQTALWINHSRKKRGEHIGLYGQRFDSIEAFALADGKSAVAGQLGEITIVTAHLTRKGAGKRAREIAALREYLQDKPYAALIGDFNEEEHFFTSRSKLREDGFKSAFVQTNGHNPVTFPTRRYRSANMTRLERVGIYAVGGGLRLDDIYVKGLLVNKAGLMETDSDHYALYAQLRTNYGTVIV